MARHIFKEARGLSSIIRSVSLCGFCWSTREAEAATAEQVSRAGPCRECAFGAILQRYEALVEAKYLEGLTPVESAEMERLGSEIDRSYEPFYRPIVARLRAKAGKGTGEV